MKSNKILALSVIALIIVNLILISIIWFKRPDRRGKNRSHRLEQRFMIREIDFDSVQTGEYRKLVRSFRTEQRKIFEEIFQCRKLLHESISDPTIHSDSLINKIADLEKTKEIALYQHLTSVYQLCDEGQKKKFDQIIDRTLRFRGKQRRERFR